MMEREVWFGLHETPMIGWKTLKAIQETVKDVRVLPDLSESDIQELPLPKGKRKLIYQGSRKAFIEHRLELYDRRGYHYLTHADDEYPTLLRHIPQSPWVLYYRGNPDVFKHEQLGIVGTRFPTAYGRRVANQLSRQLSDQGWCMVSGMARGIDSESHWGALAGKGKTIGVLGTPIDYVYPPENRKLYDQVAAEGLIISEYPLQTVMAKGMFPYRNRIIAGLSRGVIVVEADRGSGSLITADAAFDANREVFAVPGPISSSKSRGTHDLIRNNKATLVTGTEDIYQALEYMKRQDGQPGPLFPELEQIGPALTQDEALIVSFLSAEPATFDRLYELSQFDFGHLHSVLISLLMKKWIEQHAGSSYILT